MERDAVRSQEERPRGMIKSISIQFQKGKLWPVPLSACLFHFILVWGCRQAELGFGAHAGESFGKHDWMAQAKIGTDLI